MLHFSHVRILMFQMEIKHFTIEDETIVRIKLMFYEAKLSYISYKTKVFKRFKIMGVDTLTDFFVVEKGVDAFLYLAESLLTDYILTK